jgi:hypothetical protein
VARDSHAKRRDLPTERVVEAPPRNFQPPDPSREGSADPARRAAAPQPHARGAAQGNIQNDARAVTGVGLHAVEHGERGPARMDRGAQLEGAGDPRERPRAHDTVPADPGIDPRGQPTQGASAQRPSSPARPVLGGSVQPLRGQRQRDGSRRALAEREPRRGLTRAGVGDGHVVEARPEAADPDLEIELALLQILHVEERGAASTRAPGESRIVRAGGIRAALDGTPWVEGKRCPVRRCRAQRRGGCIPELEGGSRGVRHGGGEKKRKRGGSQRGHRSTTVSARLPLVPGAPPSGIVSPRTT